MESERDKGMKNDLKHDWIYDEYNAHDAAILYSVIGKSGLDELPLMYVEDSNQWYKCRDEANYPKFESWVPVTEKDLICEMARTLSSAYRDAAQEALAHGLEYEYQNMAMMARNVGNVDFLKDVLYFLSNGYSKRFWGIED